MKRTRNNATISAIRLLIAQLGTKDGEVRQRARQSLVAIGKPAVPLLIEALSNHDAQVRWEAVKTIGEIRAPIAAAALVETLEDEEFDVRWLAAEALIALGREAVVPLLKALL